MRGKGKDYQLGDKVSGITPAYAGKSSDYKAGKSWSWDHPRLCGEKRRNMFQLTSLPGSPPPMRGKAAYPISTPAVHGITPAYAGKRNHIGHLAKCF